MTDASSSLYEIPVKTIAGETTTLASFKGEVLLIVNVASQCGFTPQYAGLEAVYRRHRGEGSCYAADALVGTTVAPVAGTRRRAPPRSSSSSSTLPSRPMNASRRIPA